MEKGNIYTIIEFEGRACAWELSFKSSDDYTVYNSNLYVAAFAVSGFSTRLKNDIFKEFIASFDIKDNVLYYYLGLHARKRHDSKREINQYNIDEFAEEIKKVLLRKKKRGYAFVGVPGVGKSSIIRELESIVPEYPFIYVPADTFSYTYTIQELFETLVVIQPAIVVFEDLDSFGFKEKTDTLGVFLDKIDDIDKKLNIVFIATINDTDLVHYSLINRPGRFDQVIMLTPPKDMEEIYYVMKTSYQKRKLTTAEFLSFEEVGSQILQRVVDNGFTQADICELVEKALLIEDIITKETLLKSVESLEESKKAIEACNFSSKNPFTMNATGKFDISEAKENSSRMKPTEEVIRR